MLQLLQLSPLPLLPLPLPLPGNQLARTRKRQATSFRILLLLVLLKREARGRVLRRGAGFKRAADGLPLNREWERKRQGGVAGQPLAIFLSFFFRGSDCACKVFVWQLRHIFSGHSSSAFATANLARHHRHHHHHLASHHLQCVTNQRKWLW